MGISVAVLSLKLSVLVTSPTNDIVENRPKPYPILATCWATKPDSVARKNVESTPMDAAEGWRDCFAHWPDDLARRGVVVTKFDEQILFSNFLYGDKLLLIERQSPDTMGARQVILSYESISAVKIVDVIKLKALSKLGFEQHKGAS